VQSWTGLTYLLGPLVALGVIGVLVLILRWTFSSGGSVVERRPKRGLSTSYGMLVAVAAPHTYMEAEMSRRRLQDAGLRATVAQTDDGPRVMVFPDDETTARQLLARAS
jgi:hypothetical protein